MKSDALSTAPTCTEKGEDVYVCEYCGIEMETKEVAAIGYHENADGQKLSETCDAEDDNTTTLTSLICKHCGEKIEANHTALKERDFPATCEEFSYTYHWCDDCGYSYVDNVGDTYGDHDFGDESNWVVDKLNAVGVEGHRYRECLNGCGEIEEETIPAKDGIDFFYVIKNAKDGSNKIANSNTINVIISTKASGVKLSDIDLELGFSTDVLEFVEGKFVNASFDADSILITPADKANANKAVSIVASTINPDEVFAGEAEFAVLTFKVKNVVEAGAGIDITVKADGSSATDIEGNELYSTGVVNFGTGVKADIVRLGSLTGGTNITVADAQKIANIEGTVDEDGNLVYNVAADIDKDGEITLDDYGYLRQYLAGYLTYEELCAIGTDADTSEAA